MHLFGYQCLAFFNAALQFLLDFSQIVIECVKPEIVTGNPVACGVLGLETYGGLSFDDREFKGVIVSGSDGYLCVAGKDIRSTLCGRAVLLDVLRSRSQLVDSVLQRSQSLADMAVGHLAALSCPSFHVRVTLF